MQAYPYIQSLEIDTPRLLLKEVNEEHFGQLYTNYSDEEAKRFLGITTDEALDTEKKKFYGGLTTFRTSVKFFMMREKKLGRVIGSCAFHAWFPMHSRTEIGYAMTDDTLKNKGYMSEALRYIIPFGFEHMGLNRIEAFIGQANIPSLSLIRKFGFTEEGTLRQHYYKDGDLQDSICFSLLKQEYDLLKLTPVFSHDN